MALDQRYDFTGSAPPTGVVVASQGQTYLQAGATPTEWFKASGTGTSSGWEPIGTAALVSVVTKTATYAMLSSDSVVLANGTFTVTLPAPGMGPEYTVKNIGTGTVTVGPHASETIDGHATVALSAQNEAVTVTSDGTNWWIVAQVATSIL